MTDSGFLCRDILRFERGVAQYTPTLLHLPLSIRIRFAIHVFFFGFTSTSTTLLHARLQSYASLPTLQHAPHIHGALSRSTLRAIALIILIHTNLSWSLPSATRAPTRTRTHPTSPHTRPPHANLTPFPQNCLLVTQTRPPPQ